jgi:hypothetical protein
MAAQAPLLWPTMISDSPIFKSFSMNGIQMDLLATTSKTNKNLNGACPFLQRSTLPIRSRWGPNRLEFGAGLACWRGWRWVRPFRADQTTGEMSSWPNGLAPSSGRLAQPQ